MILKNIIKPILIHRERFTRTVKKISKEISEFDDENQSKWFMPDEYKDIDMWKYSFR